MELLFATTNTNKLKEVRQIADRRIQIHGLDEFGFIEDIPETHDTLEENASEKAWHIYNKYHKNCFAEDTGLEVEALNGAPGVYSARYAGPNKSTDDNINHLLKELKDVQNRRARFRTLLSLVIDGNESLFEGVINGVILKELRGSSGFGYDPVFKPDGSQFSFAEMTEGQKGRISHRAIAFQNMINYLVVNHIKVLNT